MIGTKLSLAGLRQGLREMQQTLKGVNLDKNIGNIVSDQQLQRLSLTNQELRGLRGSLGLLTLANQKAGKAASETNRAFGATANALGDVARRVFIWGALSAAIFGAFQSLKEFYDLTIDVNKELAELRKVIADVEDFAGIQDRAFNLAIEFGADPIETLDVLKQFAQAGLDIEDSFKAARAALIGVNVTGATTQEVFNAIISASRIFNIAVEDATSVIDKIQAVERAFAVDPKDLIASITAIGPAITTLGGDIDDLFGNIAALGEAARISGREAGNSLKRTLSRIASEEGIRALQSIGVQVLESADTYRPLRDILKDLSVALQSATQTQKQNLAITLAQVRQYPKFLALIENYVRATEAIEISQNAQGEAFEANQRIIESYANQLQSADAKVKKFATSVLDSTGGITQTVNNVRFGLAGFASALDELGVGPIAGVISQVGILGIAILALKPILFGMNRELRAATAGMNIFQLATKNGVANLKGLSAAQKAATRSTALWSLSIAGVVVGLAALAYIYGKFTRDARQRNAVIESITKDISELKEELSTIDFSGLDVQGGESKFSAIISTFKELENRAGGAKIKADEFRDAYAKLIFGVNYSELDTTELEELESILQRVAKVAEELSLRPFTESLKSQFEGVPAALNAAIKAIEEGGITLSSKDVYGIERISAFSEALKELAEIGVDPFGSIDPQQVKSVGETVQSLVQEIIDYEAVVKRTGKLEGPFNNLNDQISKFRTDKVADITSQLASLVNIDNLIKQAAEDTGIALENAIISDSAVKEADIFAEASQKVIDELLRIGRERITKDSVYLKYAEQVRALSPVLEEGARNLGRFAIELNKVALLSGLKSSTAAIISGLEAQLIGIGAIGRVGADIAGTYNVAEEGVKAIDESLRKLTRTLGDNEAKIKSLELEANLLDQVIFDLQNRKDIVALDPNAVGNFKRELADVKQEQLVLSEINKINLDVIRSQVEQLLNAKAVLQDLLSVENARKTIIEGQRDLIGEVLKRQADLNNLRFDFDTDALAENDKIFNKILDSQLKYYDNLLRSNLIEKEVAEEKKNQLIVTENIAKVTRKLDAQLSRTADLYQDIRSSASALGDEFADLLTNQDRFFDALQSRGSLIEILGQGVDAVARIIAEQDARIIAEQIARGSKGIFSEARSELEAIEADIKKTINEVVVDPRIGLSISDPIFNASQEAAKVLEQGLISGAAAMERVIAALPQLLIDSFKQAQAFAEGATLGDIAPAVELKGDNEKVVKSIQSQQQSVNEHLRQIALTNTRDVGDKLKLELERTNTILGIMSADIKAQIKNAVTQDPAVDQARKTDVTNALIRQLTLRVGQAAAFAIGGPEASPAIQLGSNLGQTIGALVGGPFGSAFGGVAGALFGSLFGDDETEKQTEALRNIEKNTAALVDRLSPEIINAPANFITPVGQGAGGGVTVNNVFNVSGNSLDSGTVDNLTRQLNNIYSRSTRKQSILG